RVAEQHGRLEQYRLPGEQQQRAEIHRVANPTVQAGGDQLLRWIERGGRAATHYGEVAQALPDPCDSSRERQQAEIAPRPERPVHGPCGGREDVRHVHQQGAHEQDREQDGPADRATGPFPARHVSLRDVSSVSRIMIFCQILRDSPVVSVSTSFTASSSTGSWESCTYSAATLLVSDNNSEQ